MDKLSKLRQSQSERHSDSLCATVGGDVLVAVRTASDNLECDYKTTPHSREWFSDMEQAKLAQSALRLLNTKQTK